MVLLMKKKDSRINLNDKSGWIGSTILLVTAIFFFYIGFFALGDFFSSYETGICKNCFGPLKVLNNPIPYIFFMAGFLGTNYVLFKFILKSKYIDSSKKSDEVEKPLSTKSNVYIFLITVIVGIILFVLVD